MKVTEDPRVAQRVVRILHLLHGGTQQQLADDAGVSRSAVSRCESGARAVTRETLAKLAAAAGVLPHEVEAILGVARAVVARREATLPAVAAPRPDPWPTALQGLQSALTELFTARFQARSARPPGLPTAPGLATAPATSDRERAPALWARLAPCSRDARRALVEEVAKFQVWELADLLCAYSRECGDPGEAVELAELAVGVAERCRGEESWKAALEGYAWAHLGAARRRLHDRAGAAEALAVAAELWRRGAGQGLLDVSGILDSGS
jgi:transcriptional regulator with XRE-family HTH domain